MTPDTGIITTLLNNFTNTFTGGFSKIFPDAMSLLAILAALEITIAAVWWAITEENTIVNLLKKVILIGFFIFVVTQWQSLIDIVLNGFVKTGLKAGGGGSISLIRDPSSIIDYGFIATDPIFKHIDKYGPVDTLANLHDIIMTGLSGLMVVLAFFALAIQVFITYLEFYMIAVLGLILIPFGVFKHTSFLAEKVFGAIISFGIRLMVLAFILSVVQPVLATLTLPPDPKLSQILVLLLTALTIMILAWHAPAVAGGLISGSPSLSAGAGIGMAAAAGIGIAGAGLAGKQIAKQTVQSGVQATKAAASATGAVSTAASLGVASAGGGAVSRAVGAVGGVSSMAGNLISQKISSGAGVISEAFKDGSQTAIRTTGSLGGGSGGSAGGTSGGATNTASSTGTSMPEWARNLQNVRAAIPPETSPGPGMTAPIRHDS